MRFALMSGSFDFEKQQTTWVFSDRSDRVWRVVCDGITPIANVTKSDEKYWVNELPAGRVL